MSSDDDTSEEIVEEIHKQSDDGESLSNSERESFLFPVVGLQTEETASASNLLDLRETARESECEKILDPRSFSPDTKDLSDQPSQFEGHSIISESILHDSLIEQNESDKEEKDSGEEEVATKRSHKSSFQKKDHLQKIKIFKSCSGNDSTRSADVSPVSSDWSSESFKTQSTGSNSVYIRDRSVSEISVSVPKLSVFSLDSSQKVRSLVKQFSSQDEETDVPSIGATKSIPRQLSLPVELSISASSKKSFVSLDHEEQCSSVVEGYFDTHSHKDCVSCMVCYFNSQEKEKQSCDKMCGESPRKLGQLSPRVKASLEKIGACLCRGSSLGSQTGVEGRKILKSKENINSPQKTRKETKSLHISEKENSPCHKAKLKESLEKINEKKDTPTEKVKYVSDTGISPSLSSSCQSSPTKSSRAASQDGHLYSKKGDRGSENSKNQINSKTIGEICDTEEEVEDMPEEKDEKIISEYVDKENDSVCLSEEKLSLVNSPHVDSVNNSLEPSKLQISCDSDRKPEHCALIHCHSGSKGENFFGIHDISSQKHKKDVSLTINKIVENPLNHAKLDHKDNADFCASESLSHSLESKVQMAAVSHLDACDGTTSSSDIGIDNATKEDNSQLQSEKKEKCDLQMSECQSQSEISLSLENESCDELLHIDVDHSGDDLFGSDFSDASEIVMGFISKSPISVITERTEESGQEIENLNLRLEKGSDLCSSSNKDFVNDMVDHTGSGNGCQSVEQKVTNAGPTGERHYPSLPLTIVNDDSSQFTGMSSVQEGSLVQTHVSLQSSSEPMHPHSSHPSASAVGQSSSKLGTKSKLPAFAGYVKTNKRFEKNATPPLSPTIKSPSGPVRATLHRSVSKSMHNLASHHGSKYKTQGLQNRSISVSTDSLERNSLRAKSLSPGPLSRQTMKCSSESGGQGSLHRRCISAIALNEGEGQINLKRNKSFSLNKLNRSRSSSLTSIASSKKIDYSQVPSKVRQYIKDMKEKDLRNSTRSLPSTPARRSMQQMTSQTIILDEKLIRELSQLDESEISDDIREIRKQVFGEKCDHKRLEEILNLLISERKLRHASDTTLATLQLRYDNLNARFAEKQNEIDRLRFYKDIHINKEYTVSVKSQEERRSNRSHNATPPNTPGGSTHQYVPTPSLSGRRSSYHVTPPNTPNVRSLSPTITSSNLIKSTLTPIADPKMSIVYDPSSSHVFEDSIHGDKTSDQLLLSDQEKIMDLEMTGSSQDEVHLQSWMKDANNLLKKLKEFAMLEGSAVLQQSERSIIWHSILHQYWCLSSQFPVLTLLPSSHEPGQLLQELGQSLQATASRFDLDLAARKYQAGGGLTISDMSRTSRSGISRIKEKSPYILADGSRKFIKTDNSEDRAKKLLSNVQEQRRSEKDTSVQFRGNNNKTSGHPDRKKDVITEQESYSALHYCPAKRARDQFGFEKNILIKKIEDAKENLMQVPQKGYDTPLRVDTTEDPVPLPNVSSSGCEYDSKKSLMNQKTTRGHEFVSEKIDISPVAVCSPAHSRESMKTVGPLEKVKLWQASLIDPELPHTAYQSSSNTSPAPSILSLDSSHPFDPHEDLDNSLTNLHLDSSEMPHKTGKNLSPDGTGILKNVKKKKVNHLLQGHSANSNSPLHSPERMECDLPKCSWRSNSVTPRLPWGRTVKARDLDSGCPGSEQSTRISHNASLDQPEQSDLPNLQSSLDATSNNDNLPATLVKPLQISRCMNEEHANDCVPNEHINKSDSRSSIHSCYEDEDLEHNADVSPSSDLITMAFSKLEKSQAIVDIKKSRTLSGSRSSKNSSKNRRDHYCGQDEHTEKDVKLKNRNGRPLSSDYSIRDDSRRGTNSRNSKVSKDSAVNERNSQIQDTELNSDILRTDQRTKLKKLSEIKTPESNEKSRGRHNDLKLYVPTKKEQNIKSRIMSSPGEQNHLSQMKSYKYSARYVSGNSSEASDISTSSHNSSRNIHNNISKLKRDLNIIKSQMMNLTSEVFHENKRKREVCCKKSSDNQSSKLKGRQKPIKALDMSVYSDGCEHDSDITVQSSSHIQQAFKDVKSNCSRAKPSKLIKTASQTKYHRSFLSYGNLQDSQGDKNIFSDTSMDMLSDSFLESKMENLPKSTPNSKESQFKEQTVKSYPSSVNNRVDKILKDMEQGDEIKRKLFYASEVETTEIKEQNTDRKQSFRNVPYSHLHTQHASVQTESRDKGSQVCTSVQTSASAIETDNEEFKIESSQTKHQGNQSIQVPDAQLFSTTPLIYIQNYNCGNKTSEASPVFDNKHKTPPHNNVRAKHRRTGSANELMVSLDEATTLAERLRLRSENMLSYLNLHFSVHSNLNSS